MSNRLQDRLPHHRRHQRHWQGCFWGDPRGVQVVFTGNNIEAGNQIASDTGATFIKHAVQDVEGWGAVKATIRDQHGRLDVTFSNAGTNAVTVISRRSKSMPGKILSTLI